MKRKSIIAVVIMVLMFGVFSGYTFRAVSEGTPQLHVTTQQIHVTTQDIDPNTLNQYCVIKYGQTYPSGYSVFTYGTTSEYVQCSPSPIPGQGSYQP